MRVQAESTGKERIGRERQDELLKLAGEAAKSGEAAQAIDFLYASGYFHGLLLRLKARWPRLEEHELEDAVQTAFHRLFFKLRSGEPVNHIKTYLFRIADLQALEATTRKSVEEELGDYEDQAIEPDELEQSVAVRDALHIAKRYVDQIPQSLRDVLTLIFESWDQGVMILSDVEIGDALGISPGAARTRKTRGFQRLAELAEKDGYPAHTLREFLAKEGHEETD